MNPATLFLAKYDALQQIVSERNTSQLLELAGILRQFLTDTHPLIDVVNRQSRLKIQYECAPSAEASQEEMEKRVPGLPLPTMSYVSVIPRDKKVILSKDQFLRHSVIYLRPHNLEEGQYFSVHDLIDVCANKLGGVHYSPPEKDTSKESWMRSVNEFVSLYNSPIAFGALAEVGVVTEKALLKLKEALSSGDET